MKFQLVCLDPGFSNLGYATIVFRDDGDHMKPFDVVRFGVFETEKSNKKQNVHATADNLRRAQEISKMLRSLITDSSIRTIGICAEAMSFPRSSSVAAKMAMTWGAMASLSEGSGIPILQASPQEVKKGVTGQKSATKEEVQAAVAALYPEIVALREKVQPSVVLTKAGVPKKGKPRAGAPALWEHCHDALAVGHLMIGHDAVRMAMLTP